MKRIEYRCYKYMTVESKVLLNNVKPPDYTPCSKCGGEAKRIGLEAIPIKNTVSPRSE